jgi:hypothetical protein
MQMDGTLIPFVPAVEAPVVMSLTVTEEGTDKAEAKKRKKAASSSSKKRAKGDGGGVPDVMTVSHSYKEEVKVPKGDKVQVVTGGGSEALARAVMRKICHVHQTVWGGENFSFGVPVEQCWLMHEQEGQRMVDDKKVECLYACLHVCLSACG